MGSLSTDQVISIISIIATISIPIAAGILGWAYKRHIEQAQRREDHLRNVDAQLREDRIEVYNTIIDPIALSLTEDQYFGDIPRFKKYRNKSRKQAVKEMINSVDYRLAGFKLTLFGSDKVVHAYNNLMQHLFIQEDTSDTANKSQDSIKTIQLFGKFLFAIRQSVGNEATTLGYVEMLKGFITDITDYFPAEERN